MRPLQGITVIALEQAVAAPFATRQLADLGARVIKIERPDGGDFARGYDTTVRGLSSYFCWLNRSKESLTLDLKQPGGQEIFDRLLSRADVFIQNVAPGAPERLGTDSASLRTRYPRLIVCNLSGYGTSGPYAGKKAYDLLVQSEVGLISVTGTPESPSKVAISIADVAAGMYAYTGILTALLARKAGGDGTLVEVSLFDSLAEWMSYAVYFTGYGGSEPRRSGPNHASIAPYGPFAGGDGRQIYLAIQNQREWSRFCADVLRQPEIADDGRFRTNSLRVRNQAALNEAIGAVFEKLTLEEIIARLEAARIAYARMNSVAEFIDHPQLSQRGRWCEVDSPVGPLRALLPPVQMDGVDAVMGAIPALGQHSDAILAELGFAADMVAAWRREGTV